ncbi:hypothetical protein [Janthinobacterium sp. 17J80-10]|uniref:hypothetical protein n=1 Tax=Janthinobacterium sp. 17J80-10 TaxID=2497863 RepID=UPI001005346A|nr:hypothetical protein [Janthinobacterium sp. 17J80-10]QAU34451.1 hypothetical protein EKL02_09810 [Janthinobacterium sp. 17J80-10]
MTISCSAGNQEEMTLQKQYRQGKDIFTGKEAIPAMISGHQARLPPQVARCINCHVPDKSGVAKKESAPSLSSAWLQQARTRRGGPAFAYERENFCKTLRSGVDPEYVVLNRAMPRFELSNEQCLALWLYLTEKRDDE